MFCINELHRVAHSANHSGTWIKKWVSDNSRTEITRSISRFNVARLSTGLEGR